MNNQNQKNLQKPLLSSSSHYPAHNLKRNDVVKSNRIRRSRSAPVIVCIPKDLNPVDPSPTHEPRFKRFHPSVERVAAFLSIYLGLGAVTFYLVSDQIGGKRTIPIVDALYFSVVTMTTVGYGDLVPRTVVSKLLACAFVFSGMALIAMVFSKAADYLVEKQETLIIKAMQRRKKFRPDEIMNEIEAREVEHKCLVSGIILFLLLTTGVIFLMLVEKLHFIDAFYCVCVTVTSLGYGDNSFSTKRGRIFAVIWILTSTICLAQFFLYIAELNTERRQNAMVKRVLTRRVTIIDLEGADLDKDGEVNAAEFVLYKLREMGKVRQQDVKVLVKEFEELDVNQAGTLSLLDLTNAQ